MKSAKSSVIYQSQYGQVYDQKKNSKASRYWQNQKEAYWATDLKEYRIRSKTLEEFSKMRIRFKLGGESEDES